MTHPTRLRLLLLSALPLALAACNRQKPPDPVIPTVTVACPVQHEVLEWDEFTGHLAPVESVEVRARVSGLVVATPFKEGAIVKKDDLLVEIDVRPFQAELDSKLADEKRADAQVDIARIDFNHMKELLPRNSASPIEFQRAEAILKQSEAARAAAKAAVESARLDVEWCRVTAPITGRISRKSVTPGNLITGGSGTGTLLTTITSIDPIYCYIDADEQSVLKYQRLAREGKRISARDAPIPCLLQLSNESDFPHHGVVDFVDNRLDPATGTIRARGVFSNPDGSLTPGFFARVRIPGSGDYKALLIPDSAITTDQNQKIVLVVGPDNVVAARPIKPGALFGDLRSIDAGLTPQDRIVINGLMQARPNTKINPQEGKVSLANFEAIHAGGIPTQPTEQPLPAEVTNPSAAPQANQTTSAPAAAKVPA